MLRYILAGTAALIIASSASAQVVNGGFEAPVISNPCCSTVPPSALPGWTIGSGNVNVVNGTFGSSAGNLAYEGSQYLDLVGEGGVGSISQSFATVAGQVYSLTFAFSHNLFSGTPAASASFSVGDLASAISHSSGSTANLDWQLFVGNFTALGATSTLSFTNLTGGRNEGVFLDAVSVQTAVPEASTWAQLLLGFGILGGVTSASRRRRRLRLPASV